MPDTEKMGNSQTLWVPLDELNFESLEQAQGKATVIRFELLNQSVQVGDVLVVLEENQIRFHGMIFKIDEQGWAVAKDPRSSSIPASVQ